MYVKVLLIILQFVLISVASLIEHSRNGLTDVAEKVISRKSSSTANSSSVLGHLFDRFVIIWLENTNSNTAAADSDLKWLAERGITLTNYWALTHPSEPNYIASVGGDTFGLTSDSSVTLPKNVSTIVDLLEEAHITWGEYEQGLPYTGYQGTTYSNNKEGNYVRKHNPLVSYDSVTNNITRLSRIKNFTEFEKDLTNKSLPQWMFITPNMINDGHNSNINTAGSWCRSFLEPLLKNKYFISNTMVLITFDENESYNKQNKVWALILGGSINDAYHNTTDNTYYTHYSELSTIENNWNLHNLGRNDTNDNGNANVFQVVANKTGYKNKDVNISHQKFNMPISGFLDDQSSLPNINCSAVGTNGKGVLDNIKSVWCNNSKSTSSGSSQTSPTSSSHNTASNISQEKSVSTITCLVCFLIYIMRL